MPAVYHQRPELKLDQEEEDGNEEEQEMNQAEDEEALLNQRIGSGDLDQAKEVGKTPEIEEEKCESVKATPLKSPEFRESNPGKSAKNEGSRMEEYNGLCQRFV